MESNRVKLKHADMNMFFKVTVDLNNPTKAANWSTANYSLAEPVEELLSACKHGYTLHSYEIEFESVEDAVLFKMLYNE